MPSCGMWRRVDLVWLQPPAHAGSSLADFSTLKMVTIRSSETSVHALTTRRQIPEDDILQFGKLSVKIAGETQPAYVCIHLEYEYFGCQLYSMFDAFLGPRPRAPLAE
jgi:hypothetical protein